MANVIINDTNLTNIANAIREKNGTTNSYKPSEMANAIAAIEAGGGGGYVPTDEELYYTVGSSSLFPTAHNMFLIREYGDRMKLKLQSYSEAFFLNYPYETFNVNPKISKDSTETIGLGSFFNGMSKVKEITGTFHQEDTSIQYNHNSMYGLFRNCNNLRTINENFINADTIFWLNSSSSSYCKFGCVFENCYSIREVPKFVFKLTHCADGGRTNITSTYYAYSKTFYNCYTLNKIEKLPIFYGQYLREDKITGNLFTNTFDHCSNLSKLTFDVNEDGTPKVANWNNQIIDLSVNVGYASSASHMTGYNSGLTADGNINIGGVTPTFQAYRAETINDYYATNGGCSKYGHLEAVETINSLPDTSAAGGGNTIKFYGSQGYYTNYLKGRCGESPMVLGTINQLTEEEIAVAAAKGWTVSIS